jgi:DNA polymerase-1
MARLLIVDGHAYAYRAFHAIRELRSPAGQPTNAIYGFIKMLAKIRAKLLPTHLIVVWDGGLSAQRLAALPEYKAHRPEMPADLQTQIDEIMCYLEAANIASFCRDGVEADDYIACLARRAFNADMEVVIASSDKDFMQLVSSPESPVHSPPAGVRSFDAQDLRLKAQDSGLGTVGIGLLNPNDKTETLWTADQVRAKTGVEPSQIVDWLSLVGDSVDNIPGVPGVGPKTAAALLRQFGSAAALYDRLPEVTSERLRAALAAAAETVRRNRELVRLQEDLPCEFSPAEMAGQPADAGRLAPLLRQWGFRSMLAELESGKLPDARGQASGGHGSNLTLDTPHLTPAQDGQAVLL